MHAEALSSSPPTSSKTHAFFSSSFAATPPPRPPPSLRRKDSDESNTSASSSTGIPGHTIDQASTSNRSIFSSASPGFHISRIFPSRYTSTSNSRDSTEARDIQSTHRLRRKPQYLSLNHPHDDSLSDPIESTSGYNYNSFTSYDSDFHSRNGLSANGLMSLPTAGFEYDSSRTCAEVDAPLSSASSSTSSSSSHVSIRLPTPPPPPLLTPAKFSHAAASTVSDSDTSEFTPRPSTHEPSLSSLLRPFDPAPISKAPSMVSTVSTAATEDSHDHASDAQEAGDLHEGDIITSSSGSTWPPTSPTLQTSHASGSAPSLRLMKPLGQGAFSAVWLAEDLSPMPLMLASKKSVRDLKRQASVHSKGGLSRNGSVKSSKSRNGSVKGSSREGGPSSISKLKARLKGMRPTGVGKEVLEEHDASLGSGSLKLYLDEHGRVCPNTSQISITAPKTHRKDNSAGSLDVTWGSDTQPSLSRRSSARDKTRTGSYSSSTSRVVAVKMTPRRPVPYAPQAEERTRIGFVREVEVLRHISHPNITPLLSFFSTPTHHVLVLPYLRGGDLLSLVNDDRAWSNLSEGVLRRIWCELCRGLGWMHSVGLVHRDVKLENILLTWEGLAAAARDEQDALANDHLDQKPICCSPPQGGFIQSLPPLSPPPTTAPRTRIDVASLPTPLIKLTDFGLSRFIDIGNGEKGQGELLSTRCGSEAYAAPELVMGGSRSYLYSAPPTASKTLGAISPCTTGDVSKPVVSTRTGVYDARETDAWACGVVLYALVARKLPFGEGVGGDGVIGGGRASHIGGERAPGFGNHGYGQGKKLAADRRHWLMRIARGEWTWPEAPEGEVEDGEELEGPMLARCEGARRVVGRLLVRDYRKRARIADLWEDEWMREDPVGAAMFEASQGDASEGAVEELESIQLEGSEGSASPGVDGASIALGEGDWEPLDIEEDSDEEGEGDEEDDGWLLDEEGIGSIARQEVE